MRLYTMTILIATTGPDGSTRISVLDYVGAALDPAEIARSASSAALDVAERDGGRILFPRLEPRDITDDARRFAAAYPGP